MSRLTQKLKVPQTLLDAYSGQAEIQQFFQGIENRDLIGEIYAVAGGTFTANSVLVANGTITSGTVVDTRTINHTYLVVNESGQFTIDFTFTGLTGDPARIEFVGRYQGNVGHTVTAQFWNYDTTAWVNAVAGGKDFPHSTTDEFLSFDYPTDASDYIDGGESIFRIWHQTAATGTHNMYIDYIATLVETTTLATAGTFYPVTGLSDGCQERTIVDGSAGTITIKTVGYYTIINHHSFSGSDDTKFTGRIYINGVGSERMCFSRTLGSAGDTGSASMGGCVKLNEGDVISSRITSTADDVFITTEHFNLLARAIN